MKTLNGSAAEKTFNTHRQLEVYRSGPGRNVVPFDADELREAARTRVPEAPFHFVDGGAGRGETLKSNRDAFARWQLVPRMLVDISRRDFGITLFGRRFSVPFMVAPIGVQAAFHPDGELATARAAASAGVPMILSNVADTAMEPVAEAMGDAPRWFQLYWPRDPELAASFLRRAEAAGYSAIVVTLDTPILGWRPRDLAQAHLPFLKGKGMANYVSDPVFRSRLPVPPERDMRPAIELYLSVFSNPAHTWADFGNLRRQTKLPLVLKGIQHPDDARRALDAGADGIAVSNHGGRQVDGGIGSLSALPAVVDAVAGRAPVLFDGGIRCAADIAKALALGAASTMIGRPYMYALAVGGEAGVRELLRNYAAELDLTLALCGKRSVSELGRGDLAVAP